MLMFSFIGQGGVLKADTQLLFLTWVQEFSTTLLRFVLSQRTEVHNNDQMCKD